MRSSVKPNGDLITQADLRAIIAADMAKNRLAHALAVRIAAGARVARGKFDVMLGDEGNLDPRTVDPDGWDSDYGDFEIDLASEVRAWTQYRARLERKRRARRVVVAITAGPR